MGISLHDFSGSGGKSWIEADYGKPLIKDKKDLQLPGLLTKEQMQKELDSGKLPKLPAPKK